METKQGVVFRVTDRQHSGKTFYSVKLDQVDGWVGMGTKRYEGVIEEGNTVKLGYVVNAKGFENLEKVKLISKGDPAPTAASRSTGGAKAGVDWVAKDKAIQYQSSRKDALQFLALIVEQEIIKLPAKTKAAERLAAIEAYLDQYTARFYLDIAEQGAVRRSDDETEVKEELEPAKPKAAKKAPEADPGDDWDSDESEDGDDNDDW
jgi:hypothetical protein